MLRALALRSGGTVTAGAPDFGGYTFLRGVCRQMCRKVEAGLHRVARMVS